MDKRNLLLPSFDEAFKVTFLRRLYLDSLNLLLNGGFETAGGGGADIWVNWNEYIAGAGALANETVLVYEGSSAMKSSYNGGGDQGLVYQATTVVAGKKHGFHLQTRGDGTVGGYYQIYDVSNSADIVASVTTGVTGVIYTPIVKDFITPAGCTSVRIYLHGPGNAGDCYFDACKLYLLN